MGGPGRDGGPGAHRRTRRGSHLTSAERDRRTRQADAACRGALDHALAGADPRGISLVAVGGYGRGELAPYSDLDVVLVHESSMDVADVAARVWYPLWDTGVRLDHSVRALDDVTEAAHQDPRVALGMLDARHLAGDPNLTLRLRTTLLAHWRRDAPRQLPVLQESVWERAAVAEELAHAAVPDLKQSLGGLRDAALLRALVATWLVDVPQADLEPPRRVLLDARDHLHALTGRASDRVTPELWPELAARMQLGDPLLVQRRLRQAGRRVTHLSRLTWRRVDGVLARPRTPRARGPALVPVEPGVALSGSEVVLSTRTDPDRELLLRAAAVAAERGLALSPASAARVARSEAAWQGPWSEAARHSLVRLLAAGRGLLPVWEALDETGAVDRLLEEWGRVRLLPHVSPVHRFTVDRHLVETCIEAAGMIRRVRRPDVLLVAALLHDIGKGSPGDHSGAGAPLARTVAARLGFDEREQALVGRLVRWHLLLTETATRRDLDDPATLDAVRDRVQDVETLDLLTVLSEADARATSPQAWNSWRAGLVAELSRRVRARFAERAGHAGAVDERPERRVAVPDPVRADPSRADVQVRGTPYGATVTVVSGDRLGLIADTAGALAVVPLTVRAARAWTQGRYAVSTWEVADADPDPSMLRQRLDAVLSGRLDPRDRLRPPPPGGLEPVVQVDHAASRAATVLEVRVTDRPGVVHDVCRALAAMELSVRSAHLSTYGPQAVDVFYVVEPGAEALSDERAAAAVHAVRRALSATVTLDA